MGVTFTTPAFFTAVFTTVPEAERGAASATMSAAIDMGLGLGPILLGVVAQISGIAAGDGGRRLRGGLGGAWTLGPAALPLATAGRVRATWRDAPRERTA